MTYTPAFHDFADYPADMPEGLVDHSSPNDSCPSFIVWADPDPDGEESPEYVVFWIDHAAPEARDCPEAARFTLCYVPAGDYLEPIDLLVSNDWQATRAAVVAVRDAGPRAFAKAMHDREAG